ncbi:hypothetical protein PAMP_012213 [Pampus punctatissimus]
MFSLYQQHISLSLKKTRNVSKSRGIISDQPTSDHADSRAPPHIGNSGSEYQPALQPLPVVVPSTRAVAACWLAG